MANLSMSETSSTHSLPMRYADFPSLVEALDYASRGDTGMNFYDRRNQLTDVLEYRKLRDHAVTGAKRLLSLGLKKGDRVALIAETSVGFVESFFACQYAGLVAVPLAIPMGVGQRASYITKLQGLINSCAPAAIISSEEWVPLITSATEDAPPTHILSNDDFHALPEADIELQKPAPEDIAYLQYTSGSTRFPRGVIITQRSVMANLQVISHDGIKLRAGDRCVSWLPFYHDMGLVGFLLTPVATQLSVDYLRTQDFAMRPLQWLKLIDKNRGTVTVAPPFGYDLSLRRSSEKETAGLDLSCLRVAGVGAEPIPVELLNQFSEHFSAIGFNRNAFMPCYGLAENTLEERIYQDDTNSTQQEPVLKNRIDQAAEGSILTRLWIQRWKDLTTPLIPVTTNLLILSQPVTKRISEPQASVEGATIQHGLELISRNLNKGDTTHFVSRNAPKGTRKRKLSIFIHLIIVSPNS